MCFFIDVPGKQMLHVGDVQMCKMSPYADSFYN